MTAESKRRRGGALNVAAATCPSSTLGVSEERSIECRAVVAGGVEQGTVGVAAGAEVKHSSVDFDELRRGGQHPAACRRHPHNRSGVCTITSAGARPH